MGLLYGPILWISQIFSKTIGAIQRFTLKNIWGWFYIIASCQARSLSDPVRIYDYKLVKSICYGCTRLGHMICVCISCTPTDCVYWGINHWSTVLSVHTHCLIFESNLFLGKTIPTTTVHCVKLACPSPPLSYIINVVYKKSQVLKVTHQIKYPVQFSSMNGLVYVL